MESRAGRAPLCGISQRPDAPGYIEYIFVDDRGTDGAIDVIRGVFANDPRAVFIENSVNIGPGPSRNAGMDAAGGEYLSFVDPDDYVAPDFFELLYGRALSEGGNRFFC